MHKLIEIFKNITTKFNLYFIVLAFIVLFLLVMAVVFNDTKVYLLLFFIFALSVLNSYFARINLFYLELFVLKKGRLFSQTSSELWLDIKNIGKNTCYCIEIDSIEIPKISSNESQKISIAFTSPRRGKVSLPSYILESTFPLPHLKARKDFNDLGDVIVYPKPLGKKLEESFSLHSLGKNGNEEFESIKDYVEGEPMSKIHWSSFAKQEKLMSKEFIGENKMQELELDYEKAGENHEQRLSQLCLWVLQCEQKELPFTLVLQNEIIYSKKEDIDTMLKRLSLA